MARPALAATRAIQVIDLLAANPTERFTLAEIQRRTGINAASAHALLSVLAQRGLVQRHPIQKSFTLGPAMVAAGMAALEQLPALRVAHAELDRLSEELGLEVLLTAPTEDDILVVGRARHSAAFGSVLHVGQRLPLSPPFGTVFLAWSGDARVGRWLARARPPLTTDAALEQRRALEVVRHRGYAVGLESTPRVDFGRFVARHEDAALTAIDGPIDALLADLTHVPYHLAAFETGQTYNVSLIAAPIFDTNQLVAAAITLNGMSPVMPAAEVERIGDRLRGEALVITKRTRGRPPE